MKKIVISFFIITLFGHAFAQQMLSLQQCKELALKNNAKVKNADLSVQMAKSQKQELFTKYFPTVNATGFAFAANKPMISTEIDVVSVMTDVLSPITTAIEPVLTWAIQNGIATDLAGLAGIQNMKPIKIEALKNGLIAGVTVMQPVFAGGQIVNGNRLAKAGIEVRNLQKQMTENEVLLTTERYFWQLVSLYEKKKTVENADTMLNHILSDVKIAIDAGLTTRNDLLRVELERNKLAANRLKVENALNLLKLSLAQHIGMKADSFNIIQPELKEVIWKPMSLNDSVSLQNRPEYKLLRKSVDVAKIQTEMEIGKNLPTVAVGASYQYMNFDLHANNGMKNDFGMVFATVSVPITNWWEGAYAIKRKKLEQQMTANTQKENSDLLLLQMQQFRNELSEVYDQVQLSHQSVAVAEENCRLSHDNYNAGITTLSDLLESQNLLQQAIDQYIETVTQYYVKLAEWEQVSAIE